ncbi:ribose-phosphate pyrophosphokinase [Burkholderia thailandensis]|uniref:ribose-phosphate diphosphokinase n=1 Tax=Burkholderia thailandensis (strain ATCC 700388 / DSM 13276 / CCUG 48851 / CIP 106301 / E264) TaxID=271848 RepID=Q2T6T4_BURTA|nr:ribose-phosphate pyrophosphokinase [Burkholderia thailandensis]ABC35211.1 ribose-phosphate pyrophosphokinase [Burkholderia thailandensis E264]AHI75071.1 ribose-phosphate diphosphokinase family protein [Burkholderia thailandensis 2002721723]AIP28482.1 ribose-phosphate pyrophosphokinase [Burkholderia thailandensis E264]AJY01110.1 ribose-phosphate diphosphokinase family protein [Burkholderia thailandensis 2002721643]MCS6476211.1 ribose-phosphate pyrophosphokinase [Burkholderia thailandensis]
MTNTPISLFAFATSRPFGERIAARLGVALAAHEERAFEDGEHKTRPLASVRGHDVYVVQSLHGEPGSSVNDKLCRLLLFIGALKDASAASVCAVVPYLCYSRKDRRSQPRDPVSTRYVAAMLEAVGVDRVVTIDVHNVAAYQNAFRCPTEHLEANGLLVDWFAERAGALPIVVVSPDAGGVHRAEDFRARLTARLGRPVDAAFAGKLRSSGVVTAKPLVGDVAGRCAIIVDDLIGSGTTLAHTAADCRALGAQSVYAVATHGMFFGRAAELLGGDALTALAVTDSVPPWRVPPGALQDKLTVLDSAPLFAEAIARIHRGGSLTDLLRR